MRPANTLVNREHYRLPLNADFHGATTVKRLKPGHSAFVEDYCNSEAFEPAFWGPGLARL